MDEPDWIDDVTPLGVDYMRQRVELDRLRLLVRTIHACARIEARKPGGRVDAQWIIDTVDRLMEPYEPPHTP